MTQDVCMGSCAMKTPDTPHTTLHTHPPIYHFLYRKRPGAESQVLSPRETHLPLFLGSLRPRQAFRRLRTSSLHTHARHTVSHPIDWVFKRFQEGPYLGPKLFTL